MANPSLRIHIWQPGGQLLSTRYHYHEAWWESGHVLEGVWCLNLDMANNWPSLLQQLQKGPCYHEVPQHPALSFPQVKSLRTTHLCVTVTLFPWPRATVKKELGAFQQLTSCPNRERWHLLFELRIELRHISACLFEVVARVISTRKRHFP